MDKYILQFASTKGIGDIAIKKATTFLTQNNYSWEELCTSKILLVDGLKLRSDIADRIISNREQGVKIASRMRSSGIAMLLETDKDYPSKFKSKMQNNAPALLFTKGNTSLLSTASVGFCGSRKVSEKGISITTDCATQLVKQNLTVVSGYANGTDIAAHKSALENNGNTVFVLAEGILNMSLKSDIKDLINKNNHFVFVSQFLPDAKWTPSNAMRRNSTIIGLSNAMILIESGMSGGTFAAGNESIRVGCPLFVVDYAIPPESAAGNPYFISKGAIPIRKKNGAPRLSKLITAAKSISPIDNTKQIEISNDGVYT